MPDDSDATSPTVVALAAAAPGVAVPSASDAVVEVPRRFAALRHRDARPYLVGAALAMMADNIEHVTVGLLGAVLGVHWSLGLSAAALSVGTVFAGAYALGTRSSTVEAS